MASFTAEVIVNSRIGEVIKKLKGTVSKELYQFANDAMAASVAVVPVGATGDLMGSGHVGRHRGEDGGIEEGLVYEDGDQLRIDIGYGGPAAGYAAAVHENLDAHVHWSRPGSGPKYLENPWKEREAQLEPAITEAAKLSLE